MVRPVLVRKRLAIVGGGPKAVALAVKARVLRDIREQDTEVIIFEKDAIGAAWTGNKGYSDGDQRLCTLAERDLGFPYTSMYGRAANEKMLNYSWQQFLLGKRRAYSEWVDSGRKPPKHKDFALYLQWALKRAGNKPIRGEVIRVKETGGKWTVHYNNAGGAAVQYPDLFDGVVITGPGPAKCLPVLSPSNKRSSSPRIFNGEDFWRRQKDVLKYIAGLDLKESDEVVADILIIGGGGTAAATLAWLLSNGCLKRAIRVVATRAVLHTRVDSVFENKLFSEEQTWKTLSRASQDEFFNRLNRGVVWATVIDKVAAAEDLVVTDGQVDHITVTTKGSRKTLSVKVKQGNGDEILIRPRLLIDATGFDAHWFKPLFPDWPERVRHKVLEDSLGEELQYKDLEWRLPLLHVPMLSKRVGPGFASLMVLGGMSDRILRSYRQPLCMT